MLDPALQLALRERPSGAAIMRQSWRDLLFLHFPCDPAEIQALLPRGITVDTFPDEQGVEKAWIGLVPFLMKGVRWALAPPIPGTHTFPETNVRTYVHREGQNPGVWFFSLDAASPLAVHTARLAFALPYFLSQMSIRHEGELVVYEGFRPNIRYAIEIKLGESVIDPTPGSLEFFLIERYLLYAARGDRSWSGRVAHPPYALRKASVLRLEEELIRANALPNGKFVHAVFSPGVDVDVFPLRRLKTN